MKIIPADLDDPRVVSLLETHHETARAAVPICSAHALDVTGLRAPDISIWAAWDDDTLLALGTLRRLDASHGEIKSMHTAAAHRGKGAGSAILAHIIATARGQGMTRLSLETGATDYFEPARALYRRHGFNGCAPFGDYVPDRNSVFMTRKL
ncbi:MAG TPA: GNAT family N-acetyltransferase [Polymorphobacter sp.]|nr:GNAT family N-acetyltransferase [Polymorphobacter sp.]